MNNLTKNVCRKSGYIPVFALCTVLSILVSCDDKEPATTDPYLDYLNINSFTINGVEGEIDHKNAVITVDNLPMGTNVSSLAPEIEVAEGAEVSPASSVAVNFGSTQQYTVVKGNRYRVYKVTVSVAKVQIVKFSINGHDGVIDNYGKTVDVYLPAGSSLTGLTPNVECTEGATITSASDDFTTPVTYTLSHLGNNYEYTVTVHTGNTLIISDSESVVPAWWPCGSVPEISPQWDNPKLAPENSTAKCVSVWRNPADDAWTGGGLSNLNIDPAVYTIFRVVVLKEYAGNVQMEIQGNGAGNQYLSMLYSSEAVGEWQVLTFRLPDDHGFSSIHSILIAPHVDDTKNDPAFFGHRMYWDQLIAYPN
jgi:hypothetical protein